MLSFSSRGRPTTVGVVGPSSVETTLRNRRETVDPAVSVITVDDDPETVDCVVAATRTEDAEQTDGNTPAAASDVTEWAMETAARPAAPPVVLVARPDAPVTEALQAGVTRFLPRSTLEQAPSAVLQRAVEAAELATTADYREIYDSVSEPLTLHDPDTGELLHANRRLCDLLGYSRSELVAMSLEEYTADLPGYDRETGLEIITTAAETGSTGPVEWPLETADGELVWVEATLRPVEMGDRELVLSTATNVTDRRRQRRQLQEISEHIDEVVYLARADLSEVLFINDAYAELFDQPVERVYEDPFAVLDAVHPEDREAYREDLRAMSEHVRSGADEPYEFTHRLRVDGETRWVEVTGYPSRGPGGEVDRLVGVIRDVTARVRREREYEQIFNGVNDAITVHDAETGEMVDANETFCELTGYDRETVLEMSITEFSREDLGYTTERGREFIEGVIDEGQPDQTEWALETAEGETVWVEVHGSLAEIGGERRFVAIDRDITEAKRRQREYEQIFNGVRDAIAVHDPETGEIVDVNDSYLELYGADRETILEAGMDELSVPEEGYTDERARKLVRSVAESGTEETVEWRIETVDGERRTVESNLTVAEIGGERRVLSLIRDITARMRREREYKQIFDGVNDVIAVHDPETGELVDVNETMCDLTGYDRETILERGAEGLLVDDPEAEYPPEAVPSIIDRVMNGESVGPYEQPIETADGDRLWLEINPTGAVIGGEQRFLAISRDVTERRRRRREYEQIFNGVPGPITINDPETGELLEVNDALCETLGYSREEIHELGNEGLAADEPGYDGERAAAIVRRVMESGEPETFDWKLETADSETRVLKVTGTPAEIGGEQRYVSLTRDVTERRRREREFEQIFDGVTDFINVYDPSTGDLLDVNDTMCERLGYDRETILELGPEGLSATERGYDRETVERVVREVAETGEPIRGLEWALRTASGEMLWVEINATPATIGGQRRVLAIARDVTERRDREERVQVLNRVLRHNLRNDVDAVQAYATAILECAADERVQDHAKRVWETADGLLRLSAKARAAEELLRGEDRETRPVWSVLETVVAEAQQTHEEATFEFESEPESTSDPVGAETPVEAGVFRLVVQELLENAAKHAEAPHVQVRTVEADGGLAVEVADDGPGVPERALKPFRAGGETQFEHNHGLGLWLVNWGVRRLGGGVEVECPESGGTVVRLTLPAVGE